MTTNPVFSFNEHAYQTMGFGAQRRYPNEELCRFMGRNYFGLDREKRREIRILELGCGTASNLWMISREGFDAYGIDLSPAALSLARKMIEAYGTTAHLEAADMTNLPFQNRYFDCVLDVFSSYSVDESGFRRTVSEVARVLKPGGLFFTYAPGKGSDAWKHHAPAKQIDGSTLNGIFRDTSPYFGNAYPFRFTTLGELTSTLAANQIVIKHAETVTRTYRGGAELFEFIVAEARLTGY